jgi:hemerythrin
VTRVLIPWGPTLRLGFADIDNQHRRLVDLINTLDDAMRTGHGQAVVGSVLDDLIHYAIHHFGFEEELMDTYQISSADSHKTEHHKIVAEVSEFRTKSHTGDLELADLMALLRMWLTDHILKTDRALVTELHAKGATSSS